MDAQKLKHLKKHPLTKVSGLISDIKSMRGDYWKLEMKKEEFSTAKKKRTKYQNEEKKDE